MISKAHHTTNSRSGNKCLEQVDGFMVKTGVSAKEIANLQSLESLIPDVLPGPYEGLADNQVRMKYIDITTDTKRAGVVCNGMPMGMRVTLLLQVMVAGLEALPTFVMQTFEGAPLGAELLWYRDDDDNIRLVFLNATRLFRPLLGLDLSVSLYYVGKAIEYINQNVTSVSGDEIYEILDDMRASFRKVGVRTMLKKFDALGHALMKKGSETEEEFSGRLWMERLERVLSRIK